MISDFRLAWATDPESVAALSRALREWEPRLELTVARAQGRLYEGEGTLYGINLLRTPTTLSRERHRTHRLGPGEMVAIPGGVAVDVEPEADFLLLWHDGPPPPHFRERFVQVWGFEPFAPAPAAGPDGLRHLVSAEQGVHRVSYALLDASNVLENVWKHEVGPATVVVLVGLDGAARLSLAGSGETIPLGPGTLAAVGPGLSLAVEGAGRIGLLGLDVEMVALARRDRIPPRAGPSGGE